jgi:D-alanine-D-alanine ligase
MRALSVAAFQAVGCAGWARVDLMWGESQAPTLLEINTSPGMTDHSLVPMAAAQAGFSYEQLVLCITATAALKTERTE